MSSELHREGREIEDKKSLRGLKRPPEGLSEFIRLANLVPKNTNLPLFDPEPNGDRWTQVLEWSLFNLPIPVSNELMAASKNGSDLSPDERSAKALQRYMEIWVAYHNLPNIAAGVGTLEHLEDLLHTLFYADLGYLKRCPKKGCGRIFYAGKQTQSGCTPTHSDSIRRARYRRKLKGPLLKPRKEMKFDSKWKVIRKGPLHALEIGLDYDTDQQKAYPVLTFTPHMSNTDEHYHMELNKTQAIALRDYLDEWLKPSAKEKK